jgi:hypothetical protein
VATSQARIDANRKNAQLSSGPKTPEGKAVCRQNALKHGLTGEGVAVPDEDREAISARFERLRAELAPSCAMGMILVQRIALFSVRLERSARHEAAQIGLAMRRAVEAFDDQRRTAAEKLMDWIAAEPTTNARRLRETPEGVGMLLKAWQYLDDDLARFHPTYWNSGQIQRMANLMGRRPADTPISREVALGKALWNDLSCLEPGEFEGMDATGRREAIIAELRQRIASHVAELGELAASFDLEALARDRAEAPTRVLFDASPQAILARKYEAAAERGMYKALKELQALEARRTEVEAAAEGVAPETACDELGLNLPWTDADVGLEPLEESVKRLRHVHRHRKGPGAVDRRRRPPV